MTLKDLKANMDEAKLDGMVCFVNVATSYNKVIERVIPKTFYRDKFISVENLMYKMSDIINVWIEKDDKAYRLLHDNG